MEKPTKCFGCGYEVPTKVEYYEEFQEVKLVQKPLEPLEPSRDLYILHACPCCGTVRATFIDGYQDKEEIYKSASTKGKTTTKLDLSGFIGSK